jgi:hypothetical protein
VRLVAFQAIEAALDDPSSKIKFGDLFLIFLDYLVLPFRPCEKPPFLVINELCSKNANNKCDIKANPKKVCL